MEPIGTGKQSGTPPRTRRR